MAQESGWTKVSRVAELFDKKGSVTPEVTLAELLRDTDVPGAVTEIVAVAVLPALRVPKLHVTIPAVCEQDPCVATADMYDTEAGNVSVIVVVVAFARPRF